MTLITTDDRYVVLNAVALKKLATAAQITESTGVALTEVTTVLADLAAGGLVAVIGEQVLPTDDAVPRLETLAADRYAEVRTDPDVLAMADRFEPVNRQFLTTISAWQQVEVGGRRITNDHQDAEYDARILVRADKLVTRLIALIEVLESREARFAGYAKRFRAAMDRADAGEVEWLSSPVLDSVHTVWFEFHEDLLRTLGRARTE